MMFQRVIIVGVGLIGSSLGACIVSRRLAGEVIGVGRHRANLEEAVRRRAIHRWIPAARADDFFQTLTGRDLVVLAAPVGTIRKTLGQLPSCVLVTDVGSTKQAIVKASAGKRFVGAHPIAGNEKSGAGASDPALFQGRLCILTPGRGADSRDVRKIAGLWKAAGAYVKKMPASVHDRHFALLSHLPHVLAFSLMQTALHVKPADFELAFRSFRDATRVAQSPEAMWSDIFMENTGELLAVLKRFETRLRQFQKMLRAGDRKALALFLKQARRKRESFS